jgi:hypothetical protein
VSSDEMSDAENDDEIDPIYFLTISMDDDVGMEMIQLIPKFQSLISPFKVYIDFICFVKKSGNFIPELNESFFFGLCENTCTTLVDEVSTAKDNFVYKFSKENTNKAIA